MPSVLIVAYGNPLRSDDGVAWHAADALEGKFPDSEVGILRLHQLAPEVAETLSRFDQAIFIDAAQPDPHFHAGTIHVEPVHVEDDANESINFSHALPPRGVLALASTLYRKTPTAHVVTVVGEKFDHGESLSAPVKSSLPSLVSRVRQLVRQARS